MLLGLTTFKLVVSCYWSGYRGSWRRFWMEWHKNRTALREEGRGGICHCQGSWSGSPHWPIISFLSGHTSVVYDANAYTQMPPISPRSSPNLHPATTITVSGRIITAALFCSLNWWMTDEVIRMLSFDWLMRGSSWRRGRGLCLFPGTLNSLTVQILSL